jgi:hypothetical protein
MSYLDDFKRMTGQNTLPSLEEAVLVQEQQAVYEGLLDALHEVAVEEMEADATIRAAMDLAVNDESLADELSELFGGTMGGGNRSSPDPTRAAYAKAFSQQAVAAAEKKGRKREKLSPEERKRVRSAAAKKAWETRKKGGKKGLIGKAVVAVKSFAKKLMSKAKSKPSFKPSFA